MPLAHLFVIMVANGLAVKNAKAVAFEERSAEGAGGSGTGMKFHDGPASASTLHSKVAVITGAESGLGREAAGIFTPAGVRLALADSDAPRFGSAFCRILVES
jgi:hypothetical protein